MKYTVNKAFTDSQQNYVTHHVGDVIEVTKKRAKQITDCLGEDALIEIKAGDTSVKISEEGIDIDADEVNIEGEVKKDE